MMSAASQPSAAGLLPSYLHSWQPSQHVSRRIGLTCNLVACAPCRQQPTACTPVINRWTAALPLRRPCPQINAVGPVRVVQTLLPLLEDGKSKVGAASCSLIKRRLHIASLLVHACAQHTETEWLAASE